MIWRWLKYLDYKYDENKRTDNTDGHKRSDVDICNNISEKYFAAELRYHRWIQITQETVVNWERYDPTFTKNWSSHYTCGACLAPWHEFHVDTHPSLQRVIGYQNTKYGGNVSVRVDKGNWPLMIIGQDESTYHQLMFSKHNWKDLKVCNLFYLKVKVRF